jgi:L-fucose dehydrogenase
MNLNLVDKVFIVTGGVSGIGEAITRMIAGEGGIAVMADRNEEKGKQLAAAITQEKQKAFFYLVELTDENSIRKFVAEIIQRFTRIDGLINNAGTNDGVSLETGSAQAFQQSLQVNLVHYYTMSHYALPHLKQTQGAIINVGSKVSVTGQGSTSGYAASKGAINALTREWAVELLPYSIRVNAVLPAEVDTPQYASWLQSQPDGNERFHQITSHIPLEKRFTTAGEIANTVVFLISDASSHTTGQILFVDGGYTHLDRMIT